MVLEASIKSIDLSIGYEYDYEVLWVVNSINIFVWRNTTYCIIGESGCGKSTLGNAIAGLLPTYAYTNGYLEVEERVVVRGDETNYNGVRGRIVTRIPQDPSSALNPYVTIGEQLVKVIKHHYGAGGNPLGKARELLKLVKLPLEVIDYYPHELSGGMKQRAAIALALAPTPKVIVADEPTSSLDAYLRGVVAGLLKRVQRELNLTLVFITHDIALASTICDYIAVMYAGTIVEEGAACKVLRNPLHPYTQLLLKAIPKLGSREILSTIPGSPPSPTSYPEGCRFRPRCPVGFNECYKAPKLIEFEPQHKVSCWRYAQ